MITVVKLSKQAEKDLVTIPKHIAAKFRTWVASVETIGLEATRDTPGYRDKPLSGELAGLRSIRLSNQFRAYYHVRTDGTVECAWIKGIDAHRYRG